MRDARRAAAVALAAAAVLTLAAGCGIPTDDEPRLLASDTTTTVGAPVSGPVDSADSAAIYLTQGEASEPLVSVRRGLGGPPTPERVLEALLEGPTKEDLDRGYLSNIQTGTSLNAVELSEGVLTIDLSEEFFASGNTGVSAFAQVVLTVTDPELLESFDIERIRFRSDGRRIQAPTPGDTTKDTVTRADYRTLDPLA